MKKCSCCGLEMPFDMFQVRKASRDGFTASCKKCLSRRDADRYPKEKERRAILCKAYNQTDKGKASIKLSHERWKDGNKTRRAAHVIIGNALKYGRITKAPCFVCGKSNAEGHHPNYDAPLDVVWLCVEHHRELHQSLKDITK